MISYEGVCRRGLVRKNNEDNMYLNGFYLPMDHGDSEMMSGSIEDGFFAVFDGMGGEECGEAASWLAARTFHENRDRPLQDSCLLMNKAVCDYVSENRLHFSGSTAAMISMNHNNAVCTNVGDSRIYHLKAGHLKQVSEDHVISFMGSRRLTQCLGIPETEYILSPHTAEITLMENDVLFLCSDGVTDMVSDQELEEILAEEDSLNRLEELIIRRGAADNYTMILLRIN